MNKKPNIVLFMCDTFRCDAVGAMGGLKGVTPNIDRLAQEGVMYTQSHSVSPVCTPARCSLLTGVFPQIHMATENGISRLNDITTFPDLLKQQGYYNIMVGKTHFGEIPESFDAVFSTKGEKSRNTDDYFGKYINEHGYDRSFMPPFDRPIEFHLDYCVTQKAIEEIDKVADKEQPFFAFCSLISPHAPIDTPQAYHGTVNEEDLPDIVYNDGEEHQLPDILKKLVSIGEKGIGRYEALGYTNEGSRQRYYELAKFCDDQVGRVMAFLKEKGLEDNTLFIFTSDHGSQNGDHGFKDKHNFYDETWRVPLVMKYTGVIPAGTVADFSCTVDITTTILGAAGIECDTMSGFNLLDHITKNEPSPRRCVTATLFRYTAIATERFKLEYYFDESVGRMFDRLNDPHELTNIYTDERYSEVKHSLLAALLGWYSSVQNLEYYKNNSVGGGPTAEKVKEYLQNLSALQTEINLQKNVELL